MIFHNFYDFARINDKNFFQQFRTLDFMRLKEREATMYSEKNKRLLTENFHFHS